MESTRTAFNLTIQSIGTFFQIILSRALPIATLSNLITTLLVKFVTAVTSITHLRPMPQSVRRSPSCFFRCRQADILRPGSCQFWATLIACLSLFLAGFAFWVSYDSVRLARWTALKEFAQLCRDEASRGIAEQCGTAANLSLPPPPGFPTHLSKRGFIDDTTFYVADDPVVGNFTPWNLNGSIIPHDRSTAGSPPPDQGWCEELALISIWLPSIIAIFPFVRIRTAESSLLVIAKNSRSRTYRTNTAKLARIHADVSRITDVSRTRLVQTFFLLVHILLYKNFCDGNPWSRILLGFEQVQENGVGYSHWVFAGTINYLPGICTILFFKPLPCVRLYKRLLGARFPLPLIYPKFISCFVRDALYLSTIPLLVLWVIWPGGDRTVVTALLFTSAIWGRCSTRKSLSDGEVAFLTGEMGVEFCSDCSFTYKDLGVVLSNEPHNYAGYDLETAMASTPPMSQGLCRWCAVSYKKRV